MPQGTALVQGLHIAPYDPGWPVASELERERIAGALGKLARRIDHKGSTAVPGLEAKPVIDIQVSVEQLEPMSAYAAPLAALGYFHVPHADGAVCPFFHRPRVWPHTHHVHVVEADAEDALSRESYAKAKSEFIERVVQWALSDGHQFRQQDARVRW